MGTGGLLCGKRRPHPTDIPGARAAPLRSLRGPPGARPGRQRHAQGPQQPRAESPSFGLQEIVWVPEESLGTALLLALNLRGVLTPPAERDARAYAQIIRPLEGRRSAAHTIGARQVGPRGARSTDSADSAAETAAFSAASLLTPVAPNSGAAGRASSPPAPSPAQSRCNHPRVPLARAHRQACLHGAPGAWRALRRRAQSRGPRRLVRLPGCGGSRGPLSSSC